MKKPVWIFLLFLAGAMFYMNHGMQSPPGEPLPEDPDKNHFDETLLAGDAIRDKLGEYGKFRVTSLGLSGRLDTLILVYQEPLSDEAVKNISQQGMRLMADALLAAGRQLKLAKQPLELRIRYPMTKGGTDYIDGPYAARYDARKDKVLLLEKEP